MISRIGVVVLAASIALQGVQPVAAWADNQMGYHLLTADQAGTLPRSGGAIGLDAGAASRITDAGMTFELLGVRAVRPGSPAARAGFRAGDQLIAVDGRVFPSVAVFAAYVGAARPGQQLSIDYMPAGGGPQQAQRVAVTVGTRGQVAAAGEEQRAHAATGLSTGTKVAIGVGAAALFGCYELGCFSRSKAGAPDAGARPTPTYGTPGR